MSIAITAEDIKVATSRVPAGRSVEFVLQEGDTAWNPASTKHVFTGPATVSYAHYSDGGFSASVDTRQPPADLDTTR